MADDTPDELNDYRVELMVQLITRAHLRKEDGYKGWHSERFREEFPNLIRPDGTFAYATLHMASHLLDAESVVILLMDEPPPPNTPIA
jgi:hypothetical protein